MDFEKHVERRTSEIKQRIRKKGRSPALKVFRKWEKKRK